MEKALEKSDKEVLAEVVKLAQKQEMKGEKGGWKEFLLTTKLGQSVCDPGRRSKDDLVCFFQSFTKQEDVKFLSRALKLYNNHRKVEKLAEHDPDAETPEQKLVGLTRKHHLYKQFYSFRSLDEEWTSTKLCKVSKLMSVKTLFAIDCEMVLCKDGTDAVAKVCVVNRDLEVVLDQVVHPNKAVSDYRTKITGMSAKDFVGVTTSLVDIQVSLKKILKNGTILVGHSLHNDLRALKLDHARVIDTSLIYKCGEDPFQLLSLNNLCKHVLDFDLRKEGEPHDCLEDARAAMKLVLAKLEQGFDDTITVPNSEVTEAELSKLLLHRVPVFVPCEELKNIFPEGTTVEIQPESKGNGRKYSTLAVFKDPLEVEGIFRKLRGRETKDTYGRPQKLISINLANGSSATLYVRKMGLGASPPLIICRKRKLDPEESGSPKRQKTDSVPDQCADHLKEIEKLRKELRQREDEIFNLQKIVAAVTRKHGL